MIFSNPEFFIFFFILYLLLYFFSDQKIRKILLLIASYFFYAYWDYRFLSLIMFSTAVDFVIGKRLDLVSDEAKRKKYLYLSIFLNLGLLGFFKYFNFFIESANISFGFLGLNLSTLNIILPVGISFYTFQTLSYTIDVYKKQIKHTDSFMDFAIFVAFFPQLIAGPIVRAKDFLPQLEKKIVLSRGNFSVGLQIFLFGFIKKVLIADKLSIFVDGVFAGPVLFDSFTIWLAVIAYSIQIYCDFSGYSDMAIGVARILGFSLPKNFDMPYISRNVSEFWKRWHISLSTWLRDYLYIPLGGNRKGVRRTYINLFITMLLGGLWHGASWNFVFWGFWHGLGLSVHKLFTQYKTGKSNKLFGLLAWASTYLFVLVGWVFFRSANFHDSLLIIRRMFIFEKIDIGWYFTPLAIILPIIILSHIYGIKKLKNDYYISDLRTMQGALLLVFTILSILYLYPFDTSPFIYFQF